MKQKRLVNREWIAVAVAGILILGGLLLRQCSKSRSYSAADLDASSRSAQELAPSASPLRQLSPVFPTQMASNFGTPSPSLGAAIHSSLSSSRPSAAKQSVEPSLTVPGWPGATILQRKEAAPMDGLILRRTLIQPIAFPHPVYIEEWFADREAPDDDRRVRRFEAVASHLLLKPRAGRSVEDLQPLLSSFNARLRPHPSTPSLYFLDLPEVSLEAVRQMEATLTQYPDLVEYAEPDAIVRAASTVPNDTRFAAEQWGLQNTGQQSGTPDVDIDAPEGWDIRRDARPVIVAVVDSGVRYTHEDLVANMWRNPGEIPGNGIDDDGNGYVDDVFGINAINHTGDPADDLPDATLGVGGHGTSVAGVLGAVGNNGRGIAGVAWNLQIMALKWFNSQGAGALSDAIQCLDYARSKGASIVNASWQQGGLLSGTVNQSMMDALERLRQAGILFVASAGNDGANNDVVAHYPSNYPFDNMVAVAAGNRTGSLSRQSNFGERLVDLVAPGEDILSTSSKSDTDYVLVSGTSFAAPHVSGILALLKAQFPTADASALIQRLLAGVDRRDRLVGKVRTGGSVNLFQSLTLKSTNRFPEIMTLMLNGKAVASQEETSVLQGTNVVLTATVDGTAPIRYGWIKDGKPLQGVNTPTFTIPSFAVSDIGEYQLVATNNAGSATLTVRLLGVVSKPEVAIAVNATNRTFLSSGNALWDGQTAVTRDGLNAGVSGKISARQATLAATTVVGPGKASFTWKVSSERNNDTLDFLIDGLKIDAISGEADWTKKEVPLSAGSHELKWRYVKDGSLSKGADKGYLDLFTFASDGKSGPTITSQPIGQTVLEGSSVFFSVLADGSSPLSYQWTKDGTNLPNARASRLDLSSVTKAAEGRYAVLVSNEVAVVTSASAHLTITPVALPPRITTQPTSLTTVAGTNAQLRVVSSGTPPLRYQWQKGGTALIGQTNLNLLLSNLTLADAGNYTVVVSNVAGQEVSRSATVTVVELQLAPVIAKQPAGATLNAEERLELVVEARGLGPFRYQWIRDGQPLTTETGSELVRAKAQSGDAGTYQVRITGPFGTVLSASAKVRVTLSTPPLAQAVNDTNFLWSTYGNAPWFRQTKQSVDGVDALQSGAITNLQASALSAQVVGPGQISFWWKVSSELGYDALTLFVDGEVIDSISGEKDWEELLWNVGEGTHTVTWWYEKDEVFSDGLDAGWLDRVGFVSFNTDRPVVARHPTTQSGLEGDQVTLDAEALGSPPLRYQWYQGTNALPGETASSLTLSGLTLADEGAYHVTVSNRFGVAISRDAFLYVFNPSEATDFALDQPGFSWTNFNYTAWIPESDTTYSGVSALRSGAIGENGVAWLGTAVVGPGILSFAWKVSSEEDYDFLEFLLDRDLNTYISGEVDWEETSVLIPPGVHYLDWVYFKDDVVDSGEDAGWLDQVIFEPLEVFTYWQNVYFLPEEIVDPKVSGPEADPDQDGISNQLEYAFGLDPWLSEKEGLPMATIESVGASRKLVITYRRRIDDPTLIYDIQTSTDLRVWTTTDPNVWTEDSTPVDESLDEVRATFTTPITTTPSRVFYRVRLTIDKGATANRERGKVSA